MADQKSGGNQQQNAANAAKKPGPIVAIARSELGI